MEPATIENPPEATNALDPSGDYSKPLAWSDAANASAEADANRIELVRELEMTLPVAMTDDEHHAHGDALAQAHKTLDEIKSETATEKARHKVAMEGLSDRLDEALGIAGKLAREIRDRKLSKLVACREEKVFATGVIRVVRLDTGEFVEERPMSKHERQADLFPAPDLGNDSDLGLPGRGNSESPESFSSLADDESEPPPAEGSLTIGGKVVALDGEPGSHRFTVELAGIKAAVEVAPATAPTFLLCVGDEVELVGNYAPHDGPGALFLAWEVRYATRPATIDDPAAVLGPEEQPKKRRGRRG